MRSSYSRRAFLGATAGTALVSLAASASAQSSPCDEYRTVQSELDQKQTELERAKQNRDTLAADIAGYRQTIAEGRDVARGAHPFSETEREQAQQVGEPARDGMVFLEMRDDRSVTTASAWFVEENLLLTNAHNVEDLTPSHSRTAWTLGGDRFEWDVVDTAESKSPDIALLRTDYTAPTVLETGSSDDLSEGDKLVQIGNPGGFGKWILTLGEFKRLDGTNSLVTTVPGLSGVSGSPLLDMDGTVVGVTYGGLPQSGYVPGTQPEPASTDLVLYPMVPDSQATHVPIEAALEKKEEWT